MVATFIQFATHFFASVLPHLKTNDVAVFDQSRLTISDAATVKIRSVRRARIGDEKGAFGSHQQGCMYFRYAGVIQS